MPFDSASSAAPAVPATPAAPPELIGIGAPLVDLVLSVEPRFLDRHVEGERGGMQMVEAETIRTLLGAAKRDPVQSAGGAASNTTVGAANLGLRTAFIGVCGQDPYGDFYHETLVSHGCEPRLVRHPELPTGHVLALVTPDAERTMRTCLGAAAALHPDHIAAASFAGARVVMLEGYTLVNPSLARAVARAARAAGAALALDLASFEIVRAHRPLLEELLDGQVDLVFANQDEAQAWLPGTPAAALADLAGRTRLAVVKLGKEGALIQRRGEAVVTVAADPVTAIDTTGAGDCWAAGFLAGYLRELPLAACGRLGAAAAAAVVQVPGAQLPPATWTDIRGFLDAWA